jgi:FkbM family methyltransferase
LVSAQSNVGEFVVRTWDQKVGRSLFVKGGRGEIGTLARAVSVLAEVSGRSLRGTTFVDVGANIGTATVAALRTQPFARAIALEPERDNYRMLKANAALNDVDDVVRALNVAVSNEEGLLELAISNLSSGAHRVGVGDGLDAGRPSRWVQKLTLDFLVHRSIVSPDDVGLVFMDVQGHEGHVLDGAGAFVEHGVPFTLEFKPAALVRMAGLKLLEQVVAGAFTHFVDLRRIRAGSSIEIPLHPAQDIGLFAGSFDTDFTDILVLKLTPAELDGSRARVVAAPTTTEERKGRG